jgi:hypothetical protein
VGSVQDARAGACFGADSLQLKSEHELLL